jgi:two-component system sensor kinase FixL
MMSASNGIGELADHSSDSVVLCDGQGRIRYWNPAARSLYGWTAEQVLGQNIRSLAVNADDHDRDWQAVLEYGVWAGDAYRVGPSGAPVLASARRVARRTETGAVQDVVEIGQPGRAGLLQSIAELSAATERNATFIHHMPAALWQVDSRGAVQAFAALRAQGVSDIARHLDAHPELIEHAKNVVVVNDANLAAVALFRAGSVAELVQSVRYLFAATPQMAKRVMIAHFDGQRSYTEEAKIIALDGETRDVIFSVTYPIAGELQDTTFILIEDVTDRRRTEEQLRKLQADYSHAARISTLGELATSIAHEVKQPLSAIITNAEASLRWLERADPNVAKVTQLTTRIAESAHRANEIIQRIRGMATKHEPERRAIDIEDVITQALLFVRHDIETRSIDLSTTIAPGLPQITGDRVLLQQVFVNLLVNAIQAVVPQDIERRRIVIDIRQVGDRWLSATVGDSGPGIPHEALPRLFEGFFTTKDGGMGMGLAICQSLVDGHEGFISAANQPEGGAVFEVRLPANGTATEQAAI